MFSHFPFWKTSFVLPIHKSEDRSNIKNYRPICIINAIPKIFENLVTKYLYSLLSPDMISQQFGFCRGRNTELHLLTYSQFILRAMESGAEVHSVYTDFSKAFDKVPHNTLINNLKLWVLKELYSASWVATLPIGFILWKSTISFLGRSLCRLESRRGHT